MMPHATTPSAIHGNLLQEEVGALGREAGAENHEEAQTEQRRHDHDRTGNPGSIGITPAWSLRARRMQQVGDVAVSGASWWRLHQGDEMLPAGREILGRRRNWCRPA